MKNYRFSINMILGSLLSLLLVSCGDSGGKTNPGNPKLIKIFSSLPRTGDANKQTTDIVNGYKMAFEEVGWKIGEFQLELLDKNDASPQTGNWDAALESANANAAVEDPDVMVYLGPYNSGAAKQSIPILNKGGMLQVSPANTWPGLSKPGKGQPNEPQVYRPTGKPNYCRVCPADDIQSKVGAEWAKKLGAKKVFILHDRELYGEGIATLFKRHAEKIKLEVVGYDGIDTKAVNFKPIAGRVVAANPDIVYFGGTTQSKGGQLAKDLIGEGFKGKLMVPDGCYEDAFINAAGVENVEGKTYFTFGGLPYDKWTGKAKEFLEKFRKKYGVEEPEAYSIYGYEAAKVAIEAIKRANKKDRKAILEAGFAIRDFDGVLGKWSFDENGDTSITTMSGSMVKNGKRTFVTELNPEQ